MHISILYLQEEEKINRSARLRKNSPYQAPFALTKKTRRLRVTLLSLSKPYQTFQKSPAAFREKVLYIVGAAKCRHDV